MSRHEIRMMLTKPKRRRFGVWLVPVLMVGMLSLGAVLGVGISTGIRWFGGHDDTKAQAQWEISEMAVTRPDFAEDSLPPPETAMSAAIPALPGNGEDAAPSPDDDHDAAATAMSAPREESKIVDGSAIPAAPPQPSAPSVSPGQDLAAVVQPMPPVPKQISGPPAWVRYAVPTPKTGGKPMIAIVIDDLGLDRKRSEKVTQLKGPLTLAWMTYAEDLPKMTRQARARGHELMLHVPMQPMSDSFNPGPDVLSITASPEENRRRLIWGLDRFEGFVGINNHMGSRFTADRDGMRVVMAELKKRGLLFLDSLTTDKSVGADLAKAEGVPFAARQVFIDNEQSVQAVLAQLSKAESYARKHGMAIAIGHPHDATIEALSQWLPGLEAKGLVLVPVTTIVRVSGNRE